MIQRVIRVIRLLICAAVVWPAVVRAQNTYVDFTGGYSHPPTDKDSFAVSLTFGRQARWLRLGATGDLLMSKNESVY